MRPRETHVLRFHDQIDNEFRLMNFNLIQRRNQKIWQGKMIHEDR